ncbi:MAG: hypothetical protein K8R90_00655 [Candidatus Cloacimonetes bacterium]|nr:hypothetical protein [Candidatus Cloacimonadota bacterium]
MAGQWSEILDAEKLGVPNGIAELDANGKLVAAQIPEIDPGHISGVLSASQIPELDASKITTGAFDTARIPALDASKISTGAFNVDRIPTLAQSKISGLTTALEGKVETTTKVNGIALDRDIVLKSTDIIEEVAELPLDGIIGELIAFEGVLYVWKGAE